jgi:alpha-glucosidase
VYEIFVDRFAGPQGEQLSLPKSNSPWKVHAGGSLDGIGHRLTHITGLGCDALYLTPIFTAPSNHKYDVADYYHVDESFGGNAAFERLVKDCQRRDLGLFLDGVFNHVGSTHHWFVQARNDASSPELAYFSWIEHPHDYECWQSHKGLPELNLDHPHVRETLIEGPDSVVRHWLRRGATGWRLDCANDLGPTLSGRIAEITEEEQAPDGAIGEVMAYAQEFVREEGLHGVMNYYFRATVLALLSGEISSAQAATNLKRMVKRYHYPALLRSWNMLASHDTPRIASLFPDIERRRLAFALACSFPGVPMIYYGEEIGMRGGRDPMNRAPMLWDSAEWDIPMFEFAKLLLSLRAKYPALREGGFESLPQPAYPTILAFARTTEHPKDTIVVLANVGETDVKGRFFVPLSSMFDSLPLVDVLQPERVSRMESGSFVARFEPYDVAFFVPSDAKRPRYSFFSGYDNGRNIGTKQ